VTAQRARTVRGLQSAYARHKRVHGGVVGHRCPRCARYLAASRSQPSARRLQPQTQRRRQPARRPRRRPRRGLRSRERDPRVRAAHARAVDQRHRPAPPAVLWRRRDARGAPAQRVTSGRFGSGARHARIVAHAAPSVHALEQQPAPVPPLRRRAPRRQGRAHDRAAARR